jgi:hypothetical protein
MFVKPRSIRDWAAIVVQTQAKSVVSKGHARWGIDHGWNGKQIRLSRWPPSALNSRQP